MVKPLPINNKIRGTRRYAAPDSIYFRTWFAQQQRKDRKARSKIQPLLLDTYSDAAAAYSLRPLSTSTTSVVRVRRSSDNTEQDFTAKQTTDGTLAGFCGTGDGLVTTWYDQSGNGNDATQNVAASQPKIVDAGVLVTENGKAAVGFVRDSTVMFFTTVSTPMFILTVNSASQSELDDIIISNRSGGVSGIHLGFNDGDFFRDFPADVKGLPESVSAFEQNLATSKITIGDREYWINGSTIGTLNSVKTTNYSAISAPNKQGITGTIQEIIIYPSDQSSNREAIEANIASHYGITLS